MKSARSWAEAFRRASPRAQLAACLAAAAYLSHGLQLAALSNGFDFACFYDAAHAVAHGAGARAYDAFYAYQPGTRIERMFFVYPPVVALLYAPLGLLPFGAALSVYQLLCQGALWLCAWLAARRAPRGEGLLAGALVLLFMPLYYSIQVGQSDVWALACLLGALALEGTAAGDAAAGLLLGLAASLKLFLLLGGAGLLLARRWRLLGWCALGFAALQAAGLLAVPFDAQRLYWARLGRPLGVEPFIDNLSLHGVVLRLLTASPYARPLADAPAAAAAVSGALRASVLLAFAWLTWRRRPSTPVAIDFSVATALLVAPITDTHHLALLLPGLAALLLVQDAGAAAWLCYGVLALSQPVVAYKFLARERLDVFLQAPLNLLLPLSFWALAGVWVSYLKKVSDPAFK